MGKMVDIDKFAKAIVYDKIVDIDKVLKAIKDEYRRCKKAAEESRDEDERMIQECSYGEAGRIAAMIELMAKDGEFSI